MDSNLFPRVYLLPVPKREWDVEMKGSENEVGLRHKLGTMPPRPHCTKFLMRYKLIS